ncbi:general transcription factor IIH subunit 4-like, partial [Stegodyphus dumicola]|uniref:general transcription factor IIH subunit 4-like n=1 Tax=Stegodyphus dumicola TaxID=202533 RepID=UPI0015A7F9F6
LLNGCYCVATCLYVPISSYFAYTHTKKKRDENDRQKTPDFHFLFCEKKKSVAYAQDKTVLIVIILYVLIIFIVNILIIITDSHLQIALIALFCEMMYRFPNFSVGVFTRESVREALKSGITADQIIKFLQMHAHPEMLKQKPILPPTVVDQIRLWEMERDRFKFTEGVLYSQFLSQSDFELLCNYAQDLGVLIFSNPSRRVMLVSKSGHDDVKRFWKRHKQDH